MGLSALLRGGGPACLLAEHGWWPAGGGEGLGRNNRRFCCRWNGELGLALRDMVGRGRQAARYGPRHAARCCSCSTGTCPAPDHERARPQRHQDPQKPRRISPNGECVRPFLGDVVQPETVWFSGSSARGPIPKLQGAGAPASRLLPLAGGHQGGGEPMLQTLFVVIRRREVFTQVFADVVHARVGDGRRGGRRAWGRAADSDPLGCGPGPLVITRANGSENARTNGAWIRKTALRRCASKTS